MTSVATREVADWPAVPAARVSLLDVDPELRDRLPGDAPQVQLSVPVYRLPRGPLPTPPERTAGRAHLGYLLLSGLVMREVAVCGRPTVELLGPGDLLRPWPGDVLQLLPRTVDWSVIEKSVVADLGGGVAERLAGLPEVLEALIDRAVTRADVLTLQRSIAAHVRVDVRVLAFLWHLAERWGVVLPSGVRIDVPLTHAVLARMVGARRPTVTTALQRLMHLGYVRRDGSVFVLLGDASNVAELESRRPSRDLALATHGELGTNGGPPPISRRAQAR